MLTFGHNVFESLEKTGQFGKKSPKPRQFRQISTVLGLNSGKVCLVKYNYIYEIIQVKKICPNYENSGKFLDYLKLN